MRVLVLVWESMSWEDLTSSLSFSNNIYNTVLYFVTLDTHFLNKLSESFSRLIYKFEFDCDCKDETGRMFKQTNKDEAMCQRND